MLNLNWFPTEAATSQKRLRYSLWRIRNVTAHEKKWYVFALVNTEWRGSQLEKTKPNKRANR
jgi:hypothetical protein